MASVITERSIDFYNNDYVVFYAEQFDKNSRTLKLKPTDQGQTMEIDSNWLATLIYHKPDGHVCFEKCDIDVSNSGTEKVISITLTEQMLAVAGISTAQICIVDNDGSEIITSDIFSIVVRETLEKDRELVIEESKDEINVFNKVISELQAALAKYGRVVQGIKCPKWADTELPDGYKSGFVDIDADALGLGNVENKSVSEIFSELPIFNSDGKGCKGIVPSSSSYSDREHRYLSGDGWKTLNYATTVESGLMSPGDKIKINGCHVEYFDDINVGSDSEKATLIDKIKHEPTYSLFEHEDTYMQKYNPFNYQNGKTHNSYMRWLYDGNNDFVLASQWTSADTVEFNYIDEAHPNNTLQQRFGQSSVVSVYDGEVSDNDLLNIKGIKKLKMDIESEMPSVMVFDGTELKSNVCGIAVIHKWVQFDSNGNGEIEINQSIIRANEYCWYICQFVNNESGAYICTKGINPQTGKISIVGYNKDGSKFTQSEPAQVITFISYLPIAYASDSRN